MPVKRHDFVRRYQKALDEGVAAAFVGAGMSVPSGYVDWKNLLRGIADELGLDIDEETDLIALAQYHVNHARGRGTINQDLIDEFTKAAQLTKNHHLLAMLPLACIWTTNYEHLLEEAFERVSKRVDRKVTHQDLALTKPKRDIVIYKMHGDIDRPEEAVLTKADYESYDQKRSLFSEQLKGDLLSKTFVFLGVSFNDPNVNYVLGRIRTLMGTNSRPHYWITRDAEKDSQATSADRKRQRHRIEDLKTYGIRTVLVKEYEDITSILGELSKRVHRRNVFFSGSAHDYEPLGKRRILKLVRRLGGTIIDDGFNVICGMGLGIGDSVAMGAIEAVYRSKTDHLDQRTIFRPFPHEVRSQTKPAEEFKQRYRKDMLERAHTAIFVAGNKRRSGKVVPGRGVREEFEIARELGVYPIPIGATGHMAAELAKEVEDKLDEIYGPFASAVKPMLGALNDASSNDDVIVQAVRSILRTLVPK